MPLKLWGCAMSEAKKPMTTKELYAQRNPALYLAERMEDLTGTHGWHGKAQCAIPKSSEAMCKLGASHAECLGSDVYVALRTLDKLIEGYTSHNSPTYDDDHLTVLAGVGTMTRLLADALEVSGTLDFHTGNGLYMHDAIKAAEAGHD